MKYFSMLAVKSVGPESLLLIGLAIGCCGTSKLELRTDKTVSSESCALSK